MEKIPYILRRSHRRTIAVKITREGVLVYAPYRVSVTQIQQFLESKQRWIGKKLEEQAKQPNLPALTESELDLLCRQAREILSMKAACFAKQLDVSYNRISIRRQRTRWGSCSGKGNLNFNCLLILTPDEVQDYVVVHELCHLRQMNHSPAFWKLVESILPDYRRQRVWLKENGMALVARLPE